MNFHPKSKKKTIETIPTNPNLPSLHICVQKLKRTIPLSVLLILIFCPIPKSVHDYNYASDFSTNNIFNVYPFFYEYPVSLNVGVEMFAVVPASTQSYVKVYKVNLDDNGDFIVDRDTVLYEDETGKPFVLLCNDHEAYSNVLITVQNGDETVEFSPRISIENDDGLVLGEGCYDFTVKDIRDYHSEAREYLTENIDEIKDGIENGMSLRWDDEVYIYGTMLSNMYSGSMMRTALLTLPENI